MSALIKSPHLAQRAAKNFFIPLVSISGSRFMAQEPIGVIMYSMKRCAVYLLGALAQVCAADAPIYFTSFTHMEGSFTYPTQMVFADTAARLRWAMGVSEEYGYRLTIESEKSFAIACVTYGDNVMMDAVNRGHGAGTHCDFGMTTPLMTPAQYSLNFIQNKQRVDALVGAANNRHCSGGMGVNDWIVSAQLAGFDFRSEVVALGFLSMPMSERPAGWTDAYILANTFHDECPLDLSARHHPFPLANAANFTADPESSYIVLCGGVGRLDIFAEQAAGTTIPQNPPLTQSDVNLFFAAIDASIAVRDPAQFTKINVHLALTVFRTVNNVLYRQVLQRLRDDYCAGGAGVFATQGEAYDAYRQWNHPVTGDVDLDGVVNGADLAALFGLWGTHAGRGDLNFDGAVNAADLTLMLSGWTG
ncbi:MAG: hypothetical protein O2800_07725 [Planctomycetota bacterium]|nr:hypothetical protein [Planctomycetota bacterium]